ncbi:MAG TPA: TetR/AcrR family transcriptional regulator [Acidimicrobiales bacterium]|jgi:AcrR family transcriptional regulator|nr:TetR/AcrR family transcriptional regulator [Acidimicrobiales bacterium]
MRQPLTREAISKAARDILVAEGLHAVSLRRVASSLGVTAPALYAHVVDKRDLLQGIAEQEIDGLLEQFRSIDESDPVDRMRRMCHVYVDYGVRNPDLFRAMFLFRPELTSEGRGERTALTAAIHDAFMQVARKAVDNEGLDQANAELAALTAWTAAHGVVTVLLSGPPLNIEVQNRLADATINAALTGMRHGALAAA